MIHDHGGRAAATAPAVREVYEVEASVALDRRIHLPSFEADLVEFPGVAEDALNREIHEEMLEPDEGAAGRPLEREISGVKREAERIPPNCTHRYGKSELLLPEPRPVAFDQP